MNRDRLAGAAEWFRGTRRGLLRCLAALVPGLAASTTWPAAELLADGSTAVVGGPGRRRHRRHARRRPDRDRHCKAKPAARRCRGRCGRVVNDGCGRTIRCRCAADLVCTSDSGVCCAPDQTCSGGRVCCAAGETCGPGDACCPMSRLCLPSNACCAAGLVCAPGGGVCCDPAQICTVGGVPNACCSGSCVRGICI